MTRLRNEYRAACRRQGVDFERLQGSAKPFKRITALINAYNTAALAQDRIKTVIAEAALRAYKSRGHGKGPGMQRQITGNWVQDRSRYMPAVEDKKHG